MFKSCIATLAGLLCLSASIAQSNTFYHRFNQFCLNNFGAESDSLYYETLGETLTFVDSGGWNHESRNSVAIAFETNLPARTRVAYGPTTDYGDTTAVTDRYHFLHLHYLTGLQPGNTYHYKLLAWAERETNKLIHSGDSNTVNTHEMGTAIPVPGSIAGPPYLLDQAGATYILEQNIDAPTQAIRIHAERSGITLDLNGFTITYDNDTPIVQGPWRPGDSTQRNFYSENQNTSSGVYWGNTSASRTLVVRNGAIRQGANRGWGQHEGFGFNPILCRRGTVTIEGATIDYSGDDVGGIVIQSGTVYIHHNIFIDRGFHVTHRDFGVRCITGQADYLGTDSRGWHHNLVKRARHMGLNVSTDNRTYYKNEIWQDSVCTQSYGLRLVGTIEDNWIFGTGCHAQGLLMHRSGYNNVIARRNFIHMVAATPDSCIPAGQNLHTHGRVEGIRVTQYWDPGAPQLNHLYEDNTIIVHARESAEGRTMRLSATANTEGMIARNNTLKIAQQDNSFADSDQPYRAVLVSQGYHPGCLTAPPVVYEDNTFISNVAFMHLAPGYFAGGKTHFRNNTFVREGMRPGYYDIMIGADWASDNQKNTYANRMIDAVLVGAADVENVWHRIRSPAHYDHEYSVGKSLTIIPVYDSAPIVGADAVVGDDTERGLGNFTAQTDAQGVVRLEFIRHSYGVDAGTVGDWDEGHSAHTITIAGYLPKTLADIFTKAGINWDDLPNSVPIIVNFTPIGETPDTTPPAAVGDLGVGSTTPTTATLTWTAVGDDGMDGTASQYDIRLHSAPITAENWAHATQVPGAPTPGPSGTAQSMVVTGLEPNTTYHFAMKVADEVPNWSELSNQASGITQDAGPPGVVVGFTWPD